MVKKVINPAILRSAIWNKPYHIRITYITLQLLKDEDDFVNCDFEALKRLANITEIELKSSLKTLEEIQVYSTDIAYSGKLVEKLENGYKVLDVFNDNSKSFREKRKFYMRDYRAAKKAKKTGILIPEREEQYIQKGKTTQINQLNIKKKGR